MAVSGAERALKRAFFGIAGRRFRNVGPQEIEIRTLDISFFNSRDRTGSSAIRSALVTLVLVAVDAVSIMVVKLARILHLPHRILAVEITGDELLVCWAGHDVILS